MKESHEFDWLPPLDDQPGPALEQSAAAKRQAIEAALRRAGYGAGVSRRPPRVKPRVLALGVAGLTSLAAAAGMVSGMFSPSVQLPSGPARVEPRVQQSPKTQSTAARAEASAEPEASSPAASAAPASLPPRAERTVFAPGSASARAPDKTVDPLREANLLRGRGAWRAAHDAYLEIVRSAPGSADAYTALAAAAALKLERLGDAQGALELYQKLVRQGGYLAHQARWGEAESYRALGNAAGERRALEDLVALAPEGRLRRQALHRLSQLGAR